jgi:hypothetical protein
MITKKQVLNQIETELEEIDNILFDRVEKLFKNPEQIPEVLTGDNLLLTKAIIIGYFREYHYDFLETYKEEFETIYQLLKGI